MRHDGVFVPKKWLGTGLIVFYFIFNRDPQRSMDLLAFKGSDSSTISRGVRIRTNPWVEAPYVVEAEASTYRGSSN